MAHAEAISDENVRKLIDEWKVPGLGVAVIKGDQIHAKVGTARRLYDSINSA